MSWRHFRTYLRPLAVGRSAAHGDDRPVLPSRSYGLPNYMPSSRNRFRFVRPSLQSCPSSNAASGTVPSHSQRDVKARQRIRAAHKRARMCERGPCDVKARTASRIGAEGWCTLPAPGAVRARCKLVGLICQDFVSLPLPTIQRSHECRDSPYGYTRSVHHSAVLSGADMAAVGPVPAQMWQRGETSPGADVAAGRAQSRRRCRSGKPSPGADAAGVCRVSVQMWQGCAQSRRRCRSGASPVPAQMWQRGEPSPGADVAAVCPVPVQMWRLA